MADLPWGDERTRKFVTGVGLITSDGPHGPNVMAAEWTHHVSYSPGYIMVNIGHGKATEANILKTKEFGVNLAAEDQNIAASIAGGSSGKDVDKVKVLKDMGVEFYGGRKIRSPMIKGAAMNAECRLAKAEKLGDHYMFIGEVLEASATGKRPLVYSGGKYWHFGEQLGKPGDDTMQKINKLVDKYSKK